MSETNLRSTKFIMSVLCLVIVSIGFFTGKIAAEIFMPFVLAVLGIFSGTNVLQKFSPNIKK